MSDAKNWVVGVGTLDGGYLGVFDAETGRTICRVSPTAKLDEQDATNAALLVAAPRMAEALRAILAWGREHLSPVHNPDAHPLLVEAHEALTQAGVKP